MVKAACHPQLGAGEDLGRSDTHVDFDQGLAYCIRRIRRVLNDEGASPRYVETVPREGYRVLVPVVFPALPQPSATSAPTAERRPDRRLPPTGGKGRTTAISIACAPHCRSVRLGCFSTRFWVIEPTAARACDR